MFHVTVLNPQSVLFEGDAESVFLPGDEGEFELLTHHAPIVSVLRAGKIVIDWKTAIAIQKGMVKFLNNDCVVLAET